jgi:hypothetical protein
MVLELCGLAVAFLFNRKDAKWYRIRVIRVIRDPCWLFYPRNPSNPIIRDYLCPHGDR